MRERIIGAIAVVVVAIVVIPWLVARSHLPHQVIRTLPVPGSVTAGATPDTALYSLPPLVASGAHATAQHQPQPAAQPAAAPAAPAPPPKPDATAATGGGGGWTIQAASFTDRPSADELVRQLAARHIAATVSPHAIGGHTYYRVIAGPYASEKAARDELSAIAAVARTRGIVRPPGAG